MAEALTIGSIEGAAQLASEQTLDGAAINSGQARTTTLIVENMVCGGCMRKVETALAALPGVASVRANLSARRVLVTGDPATTTAPQFVEALATVGFAASELVSDTEQDVNRDEKDLLRRVAVAGFAAANIMLLSVSVWSGGGGDMSPTVQALFHWLSAAIAVPTIAYAGQPFFKSAVSAITARRLNMDVPISLGVLLATAMSLFQTFQQTEQVYFDAAVTLIFFLLLGRFLDTRMRARATGAAANLLGLRNTPALVQHPDGTTEALSASSLTQGMRILVAAGERIAVDGRVIEGRGDVNAAIITGESTPRAVGAGDDVFAGSINLAGNLVIEATATDENTLLSEVARLMAAAEQGRGRYVRLADRAAAIYAPAVHLVAFATVLGWLMAGADWQTALTIGIATLIITCPCALALAVPAVQVAASSRLFARGIIVKAADGLERLAETDTVVFDKTGTLTFGTPRLGRMINGADEDLATAARIAIKSKHPYARALVETAIERGINVDGLADVTEIPGCGLECRTLEGVVRLGSPTWCAIESGDEAAIWLCRPDQAPVGFTFDETLRPDAAEVAAQLERAGITVEILSGDRSKAVSDIAAKVGIKHWRALQTPAEKIARIDELKSAGRRVLMVGDGLNDAPALAAANASISPVSAADISQTTADMVFQGDALGGIIEAIGVAKETHRMALQNFAIAIAYNAVFVPLAMAGVVTPLLAAVAMSASSIGVTANALRLRGKRVRIDR